MISLFLFIVSLYNSIAAHSFSSIQQLCHPDECSALLQFKESFIISCKHPYSNPKFASWKFQGESGDCCSWDGVECDEETDHLIGLDLSSSCLNGFINSNSSLFQLLHLQRLDLAQNHFNFSPIPSQLGHLSGLTHLNLSFSNFSNQIPSEFSKLSKLTTLDLSGNDQLQLKKPNLGSLVQNLTSLEKLHLSGVKISSTVPDLLANISSLTSLLLSQCELHGQFPTEIFLLPNLRMLNVSYNLNLTGNLPSVHWRSSLTSLKLSFTNFTGELPTSTGKLSSLKELDISSCKFSGTIPSTLQNLTQITYLDLSQNNFTGQITSSLSWISKLSKLATLFLFNINLSGEIPSYIANLTQLTHLGLGANQLTGPIPSWLMNVSQLSILCLCQNQLSGPIPSQIMHLTKLEELDLSSNQFQGPVPSSVFKLKSLKFLDLSSNTLNGVVELNLLLELKSLAKLQLSFNNISLNTRNSMNANLQNLDVLGLASCNLVEFPNFLRYQEKLSWLDLSINSIHGQIPNWLRNMSVKTLEFMNLSHNSLIGFDKDPVVLHWSSLATIDLSFNMLQGSLPIPPTSAVFYQVSSNKLTGKISPMICDLSSLSVLDLSSNSLSGMLPQCLGNFSRSLSILNLKNNSFEGNVPQSWTKGNTFRMIDLSHNQLEGQVPKSFVNCVDLEFLNLGNNQITDSFPSWLGTLPELRVIVLRSNRFHGTIENPETSFQFPKLQIIDVSYNNFTGKLPSGYFQYWNTMKVVDASHITYMQKELMPGWIPIYKYYGNYGFSLTICNKGMELVYPEVSNMLRGIDFSGNKFEAEIPTSIGNLQGLHFINLSSNNLSGQIPSSLGNITELESLDLSHNKLSGEIPVQLTHLTFLSYLNVSNNHLTGSIPHGRQFDTFLNNSFVGNSGLCGKPLSKKCENSDEFTGSKDRWWLSPCELELTIVLMGYASGLVIGVVLGLTIRPSYHESFTNTIRRRINQKANTKIEYKEYMNNFFRKLIHF